MKKINLAIFTILSMCFSLQAQENNSKVKKSIIIIVDGIPTDIIEKTNTPNIDLISKEGGYTRAYMGGERGGYSETPTISAVCYTSMITGTWGNKHNVWGNDLKAPNYNYWTLFRHLKNSQPNCKIGIYSTWLDNRTKLIGEGLPQTNNLQFDYKFDGYEYDTVRFPHDKETTYILKIDEEVVTQAAKSLKNDAPDLSWVYLQYTDNAGHIFGDGPGMIDAVEKADRQVGELYNAIKYREQYHNEDWFFIVITDHGRDVATGFNHGGQTDRERNIWFSTNHKSLNKHFHAHTPGIVDILPSVARHLNINISKEQKYELDGVPFIGEVSIADPKATLSDNKLKVEWTPFSQEGKINLYITSTNNFKEGGSDKYTFLGEFDQKSRKAEIEIPKTFKNDKTFKVVIEGKHNALNRWVFRN